MNKVKTTKPISETLRLYFTQSNLPDGQYCYDDEYFRIECGMVVDVWKEDQD
ncbi:hypothetical protein [uncultured Bifidobacterium sp.]|uniref:hypothetical protein n=1 Tax=uncultured Bifidobacterium sp. TaxID=165187 RepID=UPI002618A2FD|nr:hypothetical protein [uncultured Bifidobacterium sp.]